MICGSILIKSIHSQNRAEPLGSQGFLATFSVAADAARFLLVAVETASDGAVACQCDRVLAAMKSFSSASSI